MTPTWTRRRICTKCRGRERARRHRNKRSRPGTSGCSSRPPPPLPWDRSREDAIKKWIADKRKYNIVRGLFSEAALYKMKASTRLTYHGERDDDKRKDGRGEQSACAQPMPPSTTQPWKRCTNLERGITLQVQVLPSGRTRRSEEARSTSGCGGKTRCVSAANAYLLCLSLLLADTDMNAGGRHSLILRVSFAGSMAMFISASLLRAASSRSSTRRARLLARVSGCSSPVALCVCVCVRA